MGDITFYTRDGKQHAGTVFQDQKGKPVACVKRACTRCGGAGRSEKWRHTGMVCYDCEGTTVHPHNPVREIKLYTAEQIERLNTAQRKAQATRQSKRAAVEAQRQSEADAQRESFLQTHADTFAMAAPYIARSEFIADVVGKAREKTMISDKQREALLKAIERIRREDERLERQTFLGQLSQRLRGIEATVVRSLQFGDRWSPFGPTWLTIMRSGHNTLTVKSGSFRPREGAALLIDATVKEHTIFKGTLQTVLTRVKTVQDRTPSEVLERWEREAA